MDSARAEPMHDKADLNRALQLARAGSNAAALRILEVLLARTPDEPEVLQLIGMVLRSQGKLTEAEQYLRRSLRAAPDRAHVHSNLGNLLAHQQRHAEAIECYRSALAIAPDYADAWYNLGTVALRTGDANTARDALERVVAAQPGIAKAWTALGHAYRALSNLDRSRHAYLQALRADARHRGAHHGLALLARQQRELPTALQHIDRCLESQLLRRRNAPEPRQHPHRHGSIRSGIDGLSSRRGASPRLCRSSSGAQQRDLALWRSCAVPGKPRKRTGARPCCGRPARRSRPSPHPARSRGAGAAASRRSDREGHRERIDAPCTGPRSRQPGRSRRSIRTRAARAGHRSAAAIPAGRCASVHHREPCGRRAGAPRCSTEIDSGRPGRDRLSRRVLATARRCPRARPQRLLSLRANVRPARPSWLFEHRGIQSGSGAGAGASASSAAGARGSVIARRHADSRRPFCDAACRWSMRCERSSRRRSANMCAICRRATIIRCCGGSPWHFASQDPGRSGWRAPAIT